MKCDLIPHHSLLLCYYCVLDDKRWNDIDAPTWLWLLLRGHSAFPTGGKRMISHKHLTSHSADTLSHAHLHTSGSHHSTLPCRPILLTSSHTITCCALLCAVMLYCAVLALTHSYKVYSESGDVLFDFRAEGVLGFTLDDQRDLLLPSISLPL